MSSTAHPLPSKTRANAAAADTYCTAVALAGRFAAFVSIQQHQPCQPPPQNVNSAAGSLYPAVQFSGNHAIYAANAVTTATLVTF